MCKAQRTAPSMLSNAIKQGIAACLDDPAAVLADRRIDQTAAQRPQPHQRPGVVQADEAAIADHVGVDDRHQFPPIWRLLQSRRLLFVSAMARGSAHFTPPVMVYSRSETFYRTVRPPERHQCCGHAMEKVSPPPNSGRFSASASVASRVCPASTTPGTAPPTRTPCRVSTARSEPNKSK